MSDPGRPALPDPQQDRHVAFPELTPRAPTESPSTPPTTPAPTGPVPSLPPDAWARRDPVMSPNLSGGPPQPDPTTLTTPPTRSEPTRRRRPTWLRYAAVVGFFIIMGNANNADDNAGYDASGGTSEQQWNQPPDPWADAAPDPAAVGWVSPVDASTAAAPLPPETAVAPVPAGMTVLRVEIVAASPEHVAMTISNTAGLWEETPEVTPIVREVHLGSEASSLNVTVSTTSEGTPSLQCRIYADTTLVAIDTLANGQATCDVSW